jgi:hypothetical protein
MPSYLVSTCAIGMYIWKLSKSNNKIGHLVLHVLKMHTVCTFIWYPYMKDLHTCHCKLSFCTILTCTTAILSVPYSNKVNILWASVLSFIIKLLLPKCLFEVLPNKVVVHVLYISLRTPACCYVVYIGIDDEECSLWMEDGNTNVSSTIQPQITACLQAHVSVAWLCSLARSRTFHTTR